MSMILFRSPAPLTLGFVVMELPLVSLFAVCKRASEAESESDSESKSEQRYESCSRNSASSCDSFFLDISLCANQRADKLKRAMYV